MTTLEMIKESAKNLTEEQQMAIAIIIKSMVENDNSNTAGS